MQYTALLFWLIWIPVFSQNVFAQNEPDRVVANPELRQFLLSMREVDQDIRQELTRKGFGNLDSLDMARQQAVDETNLVHLKRIIDRHGWPTRYMVGEDGVDAAFLIVQHADPAFQKEMYPALEEAYRRGDLAGGNYALITDRVLVNEGKPQRYGTQAQISRGRLVMDAIENPEHVDERRAALGLQSLREYVRELEKLYGMEVVVRL